MKKILLIILPLFFCSQSGICQIKSKQQNSDSHKIEKTVSNFLKWYKSRENDTAKNGTSRPSYSLTKGGYPDTTTKQVINMEGVEVYLSYLRKSGYFSESYLNDLRQYFKEIDKGMQTAPKTNTLIAVPGLNTDWILKTFEPEMVLDHIKNGRFDKVNIIYNKAIVRFRISKVVQMLFTLTKINNKWLIDYIGYDNTYKFSLGRE